MTQPDFTQVTELPGNRASAEQLEMIHTRYALARRPIDQQIVEEVARDFRLQPQQKERGEGRADDGSAARHGAHATANGGTMARTDPPTAGPAAVPKRLFARLRGGEPSGAVQPSGLPRLGAIKRR